MFKVDFKEAKSILMILRFLADPGEATIFVSILYKAATAKRLEIALSVVK